MTGTDTAGRRSAIRRTVRAATLRRNGYEIAEPAGPTARRRPDLRAHRAAPTETHRPRLTRRSRTMRRTLPPFPSRCPDRGTPRRLKRRPAAPAVRGEGGASTRSERTWTCVSTAAGNARIGWPASGYQAVAVAHLGDALRFEPALGVDRGLAAVAGGRDGLAIAVIVDVAGDEDAVDLRAGLVAHDEVAHRVDLEPVAEDVGVRLVADGDEQAVDLQRRRLAGRVSRRRTPLTSASPRTSSTSVFDANVDLGVGQRAVLHDLAAAEAGRAGAAGGPSSRSASGRCASSRAVSPPPTTATSLSRKKKPSHVAQALTPRPRSRVSLSRPSQSADAPVATITRVGRVLDAARPEPERPRGEVDALDVDVDDPRAEALGLRAEHAPSAPDPGCPPGSPGSSRRRW